MGVVGMIKVNFEELKNLLYFLGDKVDEVYKKETDRVIENYIRELEEKPYNH
jgi:hypothetical protein